MTTINNEVERGKALMIARLQHEHCDLGLPDNDNDQTEDLRRPGPRAAYAEPIARQLNTAR